MTTTWTITRVFSDTDRRRAFQLIESHVAGFSASRAMKTETGPRRLVSYFLPVLEDGSRAEGIVLRAVDEDGNILGAASAHAPYPEGYEAHRNGNDPLAFGLLQTRRTLAGLAVAPGARSQGLARALVDEVTAIAAAEGAVWLTGFMDERNGDPGFYEHVGFSLTKRNQALPPLPPAAAQERHPSYVNGRWFYRAIGGSAA